MKKKNKRKRVLPKDVQCPHCKEDCIGCGCCKLIKYYKESKQNKKDL